LARTEASRAAVFIYITPVMTAILSFLFLGEQLSAFFVVGSLLVLCGAYITSYGRQQASA
jgi:drug/metabolite transporter (DMT)-like permease